MRFKNIYDAQVLRLKVETSCYVAFTDHLQVLLLMIYSCVACWKMYYTQIIGILLLLVISILDILSGTPNRQP